MTRIRHFVGSLDLYGVMENGLLLARDGEMEIRGLGGIPFGKLAEAFMEAFDGYSVTFGPDRLRDMMRRRGADMELSFGAFSEGRLVSFILNGIGMYGGARCAYDTGTGTVPAFRGRGLTDRIFSCSLDVLRQAGVKRYVLEVLQDNLPAIRIYTRQGFAVDRELDCYACRKDIPFVLPSDMRIRRITAQEAAAMQCWFDSSPSWQNSIESVLRGGEAMTCVAACDSAGMPLGFGVTESAYGDMSMLAVNPAYRRRGVGRALLSEMMRLSMSDVCRFVNADAADTGLGAFLASCGYELACRQFEMSRDI